LSDWVTYVDEQKADSLQQALANDYSLTHQGTFSPSGGPHNKGAHSNRKLNSDESQSAGKGEDFFSAVCEEGCLVNFTSLKQHN